MYYIDLKGKRRYNKYVKAKKYQVALPWEKEHAKKIAKILAGQYGYPPL